MMWVISSFGRIWKISFWKKKHMLKGVTMELSEEGSEKTHPEQNGYCIPPDCNGWCNSYIILVYLLEVYWRTFLRELHPHLLSTRCNMKNWSKECREKHLQKSTTWRISRDVLHTSLPPHFITAWHLDCHPQIELQWLECTKASISCKEGCDPTYHHTFWWQRISTAIFEGLG